MATINEVLASSDLFKGIPDEALIKIAALAQVESHEAGAILFTEGSAARDVYIIEEGRVAMDLSLSPTPGVGKQTTVETLSNGQSCGWSAVGGTAVYSMTARCTEPVRVIAINGERLRSLLDENPDIGYRVMESMAKIISSRLRNIRMALRVVHR